MSKYCSFLKGINNFGVKKKLIDNIVLGTWTKIEGNEIGTNDLFFSRILTRCELNLTFLWAIMNSTKGYRVCKKAYFYKQLTIIWDIVVLSSTCVNMGGQIQRKGFVGIWS